MSESHVRVIDLCFTDIASDIGLLTIIEYLALPAANEYDASLEYCKKYSSTFLSV